MSVSVPSSAATWRVFFFLIFFILVLYYGYMFQGLSLAIQLKFTDNACKFVGTTPGNTKIPFYGHISDLSFRKFA